MLQYFLSVKCLTDYIHEVESSVSEDVGNDFVEVKLLLQNHSDLSYTMEALSQQVCMKSYIHIYVHTTNTHLYAYMYTCIHAHTQTHTRTQHTRI